MEVKGVVHPKRFELPTYRSGEFVTGADAMPFYETPWQPRGKDPSHRTAPWPLGASQSDIWLRIRRRSCSPGA